MPRYEPVPMVDTNVGHVISIQESSKRSSPSTFISRLSSPIKLSSISQTHFEPLNPNLPPRFVKLLGLPPPNSDGSITNPPIEIIGGDERNHIMDVLDADNEDPFTLDTMESLIHSHAKKGLDFIIARVTTVDPEDEKRFYYSYYAAHHINKVLFRTQPEEGLLHRMRAKNPLNNMTIVGDVHYYAVSRSSAQSRIDDLAKFDLPKSSPLGKVGASIIHAIFPETIEKSSRNGIRNHFRSKSGDTHLAADIFNRSLFSNSCSSGKKRTLHLIARPEAFEMSSTEISKFSIDMSPKKYDQSIESAVSKVKDKSRQRRESSRRSSFDDAFRDPLPASVTATTVAPGGNPLPDIAIGSCAYINSVSGPSQLQMDTPTTAELHRHHNVRSFAFSNDHTGSMTVQDWVHRQAANKAVSINGSPHSPSPTSSSSSGPGGSERKRNTKSNNANNNNTLPATLSSTSATTSIPLSDASHHNSALPEFFYEAIYYGSDDDFLMKASVRSYFKEHALDSEDAVLFTISAPSDSSEQPADQHPALLNFMYSVTEADTERSAFRNLDTAKMLKWAMVLYAIMAFVIVKFLGM
ncbi:hypothetical protein BASA50_011292 [Batrachochytrium salamandrivorans]|uniref:Uncharacterized protein n=1 Tax=Batrachochytrium salamandrivorans TaxID=1357716 RepID=A0ABQ8EWR2_9FUNG|nr:hypothetical protein BASA62_002203 [Batrachochytrium salamandrivorans]KAH6587688.1 hypothetical protein BASA50_011292 [Batrachochytrium salamandrivorans]KAH6602266.1 hypothetical protein BASA61_001324 [Batrachochytrium salamandrivorans]